MSLFAKQEVVITPKLTTFSIKSKPTRYFLKEKFKYFEKSSFTPLAAIPPPIMTKATSDLRQDGKVNARCRWRRVCGGLRSSDSSLNKPL
jgi:hypothetical protein